MKNKQFFLNTLFFIFATFVIYMKLPGILNHFKFQDKKAPDFQVRIFNGDQTSIENLDQKIIIVFWATWCGPCEIELKRINKMILEKKLQPHDVLAIASGENISTISEAVQKQNYQFQIGVDSDGSVAKLYQLSATPTIIFIDEKKIIRWMTSGISPTLEFRITSFLN